RAVRADRAEFTAQAMTVLDHAAELRVAGRLDGALVAAAAAGRRAVVAEDAAAARSASSAAAIPLSIGASVLGALLIGITLYGPSGGDPGAMSPMALAVLVLLPLSAFEAVGTLPAAAQTLTTARAALHRIEEVQAPADNMTELRSSTDAHPTRDTQRDGARTHAVSSDARSAHEVEPENPRPDAVPAVPRTADTLVDGALIGNVGSGPWRIPELPDARRIVIVGPSGAGKTTLLMAWAGLFDRPVPGVTFFAEDAHLFGTSVLENLRVARGDLGAAEAEQALRAVGLGAWLDSLPDGVHTDLVGGAAAVSGGQRRRILLARALISPARVLLLDEPTEHLEADTGAVLLRALLDADSGMVAPERQVVVVTHQLPVNHKADMVLRVDGSGQVRAFFPQPSAVGVTVQEIPLPTGAAAD
ncbi:ATP-binding cassette domain-containing protein, partial [Nocardia donostiensis]